jgi:hypothetical protein
MSGSSLGLNLVSDMYANDSMTITSHVKNERENRPIKSNTLDVRESRTMSSG